MSHLLFGNILTFHDTSASSSNVAWHLVSLGMKQKLHVQLGCNVAQGPVFEMLKMSKTGPFNSFVFLLTASPTDNTSDALMSPSFFGPGFLKDMTPIFMRIQHWIEAVLESKEVSGIELYMTEGFETEDSFVNISISADTFAETLVKILEREYDIPSIKMSFQKV